MLYLLDDLKLAFYKSNDALDEELYLDSSVACKLKSNKKFVLKSSYYYKCIECDDAKDWVTLINKKLLEKGQPPHPKCVGCQKKNCKK